MKSSTSSSPVRLKSCSTRGDSLPFNIVFRKISTTAQAWRQSSGPAEQPPTERAAGNGTHGPSRARGPACQRTRCATTAPARRAPLAASPPPSPPAASAPAAAPPAPSEVLPAFRSPCSGPRPSTSRLSTGPTRRRRGTLGSSRASSFFAGVLAWAWAWALAGVFLCFGALFGVASAVFGAIPRAPPALPRPRERPERERRPPGAGCLGPGLAAWGGGSPAAVRSPAPGSPPGPCAPSAASPPVWLWACRVCVGDRVGVGGEACGPKRARGEAGEASPGANWPPFPPNTIFIHPIPSSPPEDVRQPPPCGVFPEGGQRGRVRRASGEGGRNARHQGCLGRRSSPGTWHFPRSLPLSAPLPPCFHPPEHTPVKIPPRRARRG